MLFLRLDNLFYRLFNVTLMCEQRFYTLENVQRNISKLSFTTQSIIKVYRNVTFICLLTFFLKLLVV